MDLQPLFVDLLSLCTSCWEYELSLEFVPKYVPLDVMVIVIIVANRLSSGLPQNLK
jgi:hypothetical protein